MRSAERRALLLEALRAGGGGVDALARRFGVSASTVRRDLRRLTAENAVMRTYGGAVLAPPAREESLPLRQAVHGPEKAAIARAAASLLADGEVLILDAGSTVAALAPHLAGRRHRIVTNNLALPPLLAEAPGIELVVLGGTVRAIGLSTIGPLATEALARLTADKALLGADAVVAGRGLGEAGLDQGALKSLMMEQASAVIVLADATKLGRIAASAWAAPPRQWTLVTDWHATEAQCAPFTEAGVRVIRAPA